MSEQEVPLREFLKTLDKEIQATENKLERQEQLNRLKEIQKSYHGEDEVISSQDIVTLLKNRPDEPKFFSGWKGLDEIIKGFRYQQLIVISAATKSGKTSLCIDLTARIRDLSPLWFPFEEGAEELIQKFIDRKEEPPLFFVPKTTTGNTLLWIEKKIIEAIAKYGTRVVFIDHLHFIVPFSETRQDLRIGETMRNLKGIAKRWNITIFLIAHLKKTKLETTPTLEDLRDSSFIAQEADTVILLWRESKRENREVVITNRVILSVQANRRTGKTGNVKMVFNEGHFLEEAWEREVDDSW